MAGMDFKTDMVSQQIESSCYCGVENLETPCKISGATFAAENTQQFVMDYI